MIADNDILLIVATETKYCFSKRRKKLLDNNEVEMIY
jgi:hypothetical protein